MYFYDFNSFMLYLSIRQYEYVIAVADAGSLTEAASRLNVSQPSLSVAISRVEDVVGSKIFVRRKGANIKITPFGHHFLSNARTLLDNAKLLEQGHEVTRPFILGCFEDLAPWHLASSLETLRHHFPNITFEGVAGRFSELASGLEEGRIDLALSYDIGFDAEYERQIIKRAAPVAFVASDHPLAARSELQLQDLESHQLIFFEESLSNQFMRELLDRLHITPSIAPPVRSLELMRSMAAHGNGVGISYSRPPSDVCYDGTSLVTLPVITSEAEVDIKLIWSNLLETAPWFTKALTLLGESPESKVRHIERRAPNEL